MSVKNGKTTGNKPYILKERNMKKIIALMLVLIICLSFAACKKSEYNSDGEVTTTAGENAEATTAADVTGAQTTVDPNYDPRDPAVDDIF